MQPARAPAVCPVCEGEGLGTVYRLAQDTIVRCGECRTVSRRGLIAGDAAQELYDDESYLDSPFFAALKVGAPRDREPYLVYASALDRLGRRLPGRGPLLDVGCSYGAFLEMAGERGWETTGIDLSRAACAYARDERGLDVRDGRLEEADLPSDHFAVVTLWDVIEHLDRPVDTLREIRRILRPDGLVLMFTINQRSLINQVGHTLYRLSGGRVTRPLELLYDIHHNVFFDPGTITVALRRAGFAGEVEFDWLLAHLDRWQSVPIPTLLALGCGVLDQASRVAGGRYRMLTYASKSG